MPLLRIIFVITFSTMLMQFAVAFRPSFRQRYSIWRLRSTSNPTSKPMKDPGDKLQRIERIIANRGVGSRKEVSALFRQGRVKVNGVVIRSGADRFPLSTKIDIDGVGAIEKVPLLALFHKPVGVVSTMSDDWGRNSLAELQLEFPYLKSMHPVGRLDADTSGLLLFSSDGALTQTLLHPSSGIQREYEALVVGTVDAAKLGPVLKAGVETTDGTFAADLLSARESLELVPLSDIAPPPPLKLKPVLDRELKAGDSQAPMPRQRACDAVRALTSKAEAEEGDEEASPQPLNVNPLYLATDSLHPERPLVRTSLVTVSVSEGKYRMVRRVLHNAGHSVVRLHRNGYGSIILGDLEEGEVRAATDDETAWAREVLRGDGR